jgi:uncharacterized membrane-anchored protein YjiN (DUF445 family)
MSSNNVLINGARSYQLLDEKMDELLEWLNNNALNCWVKQRVFSHLDELPNEKTARIQLESLYR